MFTRALPKVSNSRKLYASKEDTRRIKVLVLNESSMPMELSGKKINIPRQNLFLNKGSMILLISKEHKLKMIFHHKTTSKKGKDKLQEEIDAFEEAPKALVKWIPKTTSSSTSSSTTTTPRIPIKTMWILKKKN